MNIFYLHDEPVQCARLHCDKHVVKMILESAQMLSTAHRELDGYDGEILYRSTHKNHPSALWTRSGTLQYQWLYKLLSALSSEYTRRYGKVHLTWKKLSEALIDPPKGIDTNAPWSDPPQCMPDECKRPLTTDAYKVYYQHKREEWSERGLTMIWS